MDLDPDAMKRRMVDLLNDPRAEEIVIRENYGRDGAGEIGAIARNLRLHFKQYGKGTNTTLVASKVPLPDYRADLDGRRRAEHEVDMSASTMDIVTRVLRNTPSVEDLNTNLHGLTHSPTKRQRGDDANDKGKGAKATHAPLARVAAVDAAVFDPAWPSLVRRDSVLQGFTGGSFGGSVSPNSPGRDWLFQSGL